MSEENLKWQKVNGIGFSELVENLNKMTNVIIKNELKDAMDKLNTLQQMGAIDKDDENLKKIKEKYSKIME